MSFSVNSLVIAGNLTKDAEIYDGGEWKRATFDIAVNRSVKEKGNYKKVTDFWKVSGFVYDWIIPHLKTGKQVTIQGELIQDHWPDKTTGKPRSKGAIDAKLIQLDGSKSEQSSDGYSGQETPQQPQQYGGYQQVEAFDPPPQIGEDGYPVNPKAPF